MNCNEFMEELQQRLDGEVCDDSAFDAHASTCETCRAHCESAQRMNQALFSQSRPMPPAGFTDRVVSLMLEDQRARRRQFRLTAALASAVAASLLFVLFLAGSRSNLRNPDNVTATATASIDKTAISLPSTSIDASVEEAGSALVALVSRTAEETVGQGRMLLPNLNSSPMFTELESWEPKFVPPTHTFQEAGQGVSSGLEPVTNSAVRAVHYFLRDLPTMQE